MDTTRKLLARKLFKLRVYEARGSAYQVLFEQVMQYRQPGFVPIKPWGRVGDRKNDGYDRETHTYFQVYAPENPSADRTPVKAAGKAIDDFAGLVEHWSGIRTFRFVYNDQYTGSPPPLEDSLKELRKAHGIEARVFLAKDLENEALELAEDQLMDVIGAPIPEPDLIPDVDFEVLREVVKHVLSLAPEFSPESTLLAPDFKQKIKFNGLTEGVASLLNVGSFQTEAVTDYFSKNSDFARQRVRDHLGSLYLESRSRWIEAGVGESDLGDLVFFDLLDTIMPPDSESSQRDRTSVQRAGVVVLAFYFEACDIFEDPNAPT